MISAEDEFIRSSDNVYCLGYDTAVKTLQMCRMNHDAVCIEHNDDDSDVETLLQKCMYMNPF